MPDRRVTPGLRRQVVERAQGCCEYCQSQAHDPVSGQQVPLYHPRRDCWDEHVAWSEDYALLLGLSPTGRATVAALRLNREGIVNLRRGCL